MLYVLCRIGRDAYAISSEAVEHILPFAELTALPGGERGVVGLLNYHGSSVPVVDLCLLFTGTPSKEVMSTRILLCPLEWAPSGKLGLLVEGVTETRRLEESDFMAGGAKGDACLGPVASDRAGLIQRIEVPGILPPELLASLDLVGDFT